MGVKGTSNCERSVAFLEQLRHKHAGRLTVIWDNAPAHRGEALRNYLQTPGLALWLVNLPDYSPDFNAHEAVSGWSRQEATGNLCLGTKVSVQEKVSPFLARSLQPQGGGEAALPDRTAIKGRKTGAGRSAPLCKCTSHHGFSLGIPE